MFGWNMLHTQAYNWHVCVVTGLKTPQVTHDAGTSPVKMETRSSLISVTGDVNKETSRLLIILGYFQTTFWLGGYK